MTVAYVRRVKIKCSIPVMLLLPAAVAFGHLEGLLIAFFTLTIHELSHAFMAERLGYPIESIEMQPFGFVARLMGPPCAPLQSAAIYAIGPAISLFTALMAAGIIQLFGQTNDRMIEFAAMNLSLGAINLLPILPLDGGRLALALLERHTGKCRAIRALSVLGIAIGATSALLGVFLLWRGLVNPTLIVTGVFIILAAIAELRNAAGADVRARLNAGSYLSRGGAVRVRTIAMNSSVSIRDAMCCISHGSYSLIIVIDDQARRIGMVDEGMLMHAVYGNRAEYPISSLLSETYPPPPAQILP